jgi:Holliday junction resolvasome RuvABC DNA-binding subunit
MTYKIISQEDNKTLIEIEINGETIQHLIVCNTDELDATVAFVIDSKLNPKPLVTTEPQISEVKQSALNKLTALGLTQEEIDSLTGK